MVFCSSVCSERSSSLHLPPYEGVEAAERLVHEQHVGVGRQCPGEADALLHPAAHLPRVVVLPTLEPHGRDGLHRSLVSGSLVQASHFQAVHHVVHDVAMRKKGVVLEDHSDLAAPELLHLLRRVCVDLLAVEVDLPHGGFREPDEAAHEGRLAAAGQAHDDEDLSRVHGERDVPQRDHNAQFRAHLIAALRRILRLQGGLRVIAEYLPDVLHLYLASALAHVHTSPRQGRAIVPRDSGGDGEGGAVEDPSTSSSQPHAGVKRNFEDLPLGGVGLCIILTHFQTDPRVTRRLWYRDLIAQGGIPLPSTRIRQQWADTAVALRFHHYYEAQGNLSGLLVVDEKEVRLWNVAT